MPRVHWHDPRMPCPTCGGATRTEIAPGYWRCDSTITTEREGPGFQRPGSGPPVLYDTRICGRTYQDPSSTSTSLGLCACNTGAIGICSECQRPVCGTHSGLFAARRLCAEHYEVKAAAKRTADAKAEWERQRAARANWQAEQRAKERQAAEELTTQAEARTDVFEVLETLRGRGCPGSERQTITGKRSWGRTGWRRRAWLLYVDRSYDKYDAKTTIYRYWVTDHHEYLDRWGLAVRSIDMLQHNYMAPAELGPFGRYDAQELRWTGILKTLRSYL
ncbi:cell envelope integrity protein TolA [Blastococcus deserti]|uniref:Cell envelope integrity protein TolA n=1 Tax=Blastococcus deserti TaxID=2259033 RepID=A0ABW4XEL3_9ACTN